MGFLLWIRQKFGVGVGNDLSLWANTMKCLVTMREQLTFLIKSRRNNMLPRHLDQNKCKERFQFSYKHQIQLEKHFTVFSKKLLNLEIKDLSFKIHKKTQLTINLQRKIERLLPFDFIQVFFESQSKSIREFQHKKRQIFKAKFENICNLKSKNQNQPNKVKLEKWFKNLSDIQIPDSIIKTVALGKTFGIPYNSNKLPIPKIISSIESTIYDNEDTEKSEIRREVVNSIHDFIVREKTDVNNVKLIKELKEVEQFRKTHQNLLFLKSDKGNVTVAIDRTSYIQNIENMLKDDSTYNIKSRSLTYTTQQKCNDIINRWKNQNYITESLAKQLKITNATVAKAYGLPKVHKPVISWRIIVSSIGSPTYKLSSYLCKILKPAIGSTKSFIKDSWSLIPYLKNINIPQNYTILSLDVVSLFTNIPLHLVIQCLEKNYPKIMRNTKIPKNEIIIAVNAVFNNTIFSFNGKFYQQTFGCPMGSPLSPIVANMVLEFVEENAMNKLKFVIPLYKRYVDDVILAVPKDKVNETVKEFNSVNDKIQFTVELENNNQISFLDVEIHKLNSGKIITNWYHKNSWSERYLNFHSHHEFSQKIGLIKGLVDRAIKLSHPIFRKDNLKLIKKTLILNDYPIHMVEEILTERVHEIYNPTSRKKSLFNQDNHTQSAVLPYVQGLSEKLRYKCKKFNLTLHFKNQNNLSNLFNKIKDSDLTVNQKNCIYKIPCKDCNKVYIGQTKDLKRRLTEHKRSVTNGRNETGLSKHSHNTNHVFNFTAVKVLEKEPYYRKRLNLEAIHIHNNRNNVNIKQDSITLAPIYECILKESGR